MNIRLSTMAALSLAVISGGVLLVVSQQVQDARQKLETLQARTAQERETIRVLRAEWHYLNRPARLEDLARQYLDYKSPARVLEGEENIPEPVIPAVPAQKPVFDRPGRIQPVRYVRPALTPDNRAVVRGEERGRDFTTMLERLRAHKTPVRRDGQGEAP